MEALDGAVESALSVVDVGNGQVGAPVVAQSTLDDQVGEPDFTIDVKGIARQCLDGGGVFGSQRLAREIAAFEVAPHIAAQHEGVLIRVLRFEGPGAGLRIRCMRRQHIESQQPERCQVAAT